MAKEQPHDRRLGGQGRPSRDDAGVVVGDADDGEGVELDRAGGACLAGGGCRGGGGVDVHGGG